MVTVTIFLALLAAAGQPITIQPATGNGTPQTSLNRHALSVKNATLCDLLMLANNLRDYQITGGPAWVSTARYNLEAKPARELAPGIKPSMSPKFYEALIGTYQLKPFLSQAFKLKTHFETRDLPGYILSAGGTRGPGLARSERSACPQFQHIRDSFAPGQQPANYCGAVESGPDVQLNRRLDAIGMRISADPDANDLVSFLSRELKRPVVDHTGLKGLYDIFLQWNREATAKYTTSPEIEDDDSPSLFLAVQQQLGLKLSPGSVPVEVLVIDSAAQPLGEASRPRI